jgi:effector-binding domain-containing protein
VQLIPIGRFSRLTRLSVKALRLYADTGILPPAHVDEDSGYRYYSWRQADQATVIRLLRSADVPLDEVRVLLAEPTADGALARLAEHRERFERHAADVRSALSLLQTIIEQREGPMPYAVDTKEVPDQPVLRVRARTRLETIGQVMGESFEELARHMTTNGIPFIGPPLSVYPERFDENTEAEMWVCMPAPPDAQGAGRVEAYVVPGGTVAWTTHRGPYDGLHAAYAVVWGWMEENGRELAGPMREVYLTDPDEVPPDEYLTEIQWPVA